MFPMFPIQERVDYFELDRLFARPTTQQNDNMPSLNVNMSPYNQSMLGNRSSSSADSTSPESYMDIASPPTTDMFHLRPLPESPNTRLLPDSPMPAYDRETPFKGRRHRPIVGRKIFTSETLPVNYESPLAPPRNSKVDFESKQWSEDIFMHGTPPNVNNMLIENKTYSRNVFYELFPSEKKGYEFQTPVKQCQNPINSDTSFSFSVSPSHSNMTSFTTSPNKYAVSPTQAQMASSPVPVNTRNFRQGISARRSPSFDQALCKYPIRPNRSQAFEQGLSKYQEGNKLCTFCRKNGETPLVYMSHCVKEKVGNKQVVTCPILRSHVCNTCGASGDEAHTITYCPVLRSSNNGQPIPSTTITLKNTRVKSNGRRRY